MRELSAKLTEGEKSQKPGGSAFPEGKVDFLQLVAKKTDEG